MPKEPREHLVHICRLLFARRLNDATGGNISLRQDDRIFMSPAHAGSRQQWQIEPPDVVVLDLQGNVLEGPSRRSREAQVHLALYNSFVRQGAVIHAHPEYIMVFVAAGQAIPPVLEHTQKFGTIRLARPAKAHSSELARSVVEALQPQEQAFEKHGIATLMPQHGIVVVGRDLDDAFDTLERIEANARTLLLSVLLRHLPEGIKGG